MVLKFCVACFMFSTVNSLRISLPEDVEALKWEHYDKADDKDLYQMTQGIQACIKVLENKPQLLFDPKSELQKLSDDELGGIPLPRALPANYSRPFNEDFLKYEDAVKAMNSIRGRTYLMAGDSMTRQNFLTFACTMQLVEDPNLMKDPELEVVKRSMHAAHGKVCPMQNSTWCMSFPKYNAAIAYQWVSMVPELQKARMLKTISDFQLGEKDIILLNIGIAYNFLFENALSRLNNKLEFPKAEARLEGEIRNFMKVVKQPEIYQKGKQPTFIWRETTPQHFDTPQRMYRGAVPTPSQGCLSVDQLAIQHGANVYNEIGNAVMAELEIPTIPVFKSLSTSQHLHMSDDGQDCTHFKLEPQMWMSGQEAKFLAQSSFPAVS